MSRFLQPLWALAGLVILASCDDNRIAGGTTETDNMVTARTIRVDSLLPEWNRPGWASTVATLRLDSADIDFAATSASGRSVVVETMDSLRLPFRIVFWDLPSRSGRIQVRLDPWLQRPGSKFRLRWGLPDSARSDSAGVWKGIPDSQRMVLTSVPVDDFEGPSLQSKLPDSGTWSSVAQDTATVGAPSHVAAGAGRAGQALHISYSAPSPNGFVYLGLPLSNGPRSLRSLDSIVLWARGAKTILNISFDHHGTANTKSWASRTLDSTWRRISIRPTDLDSANGIGGNVGWAGVRDSVTHLCLFAARGADMWIDDIRLYGIDRDDLR